MTEDVNTETTAVAEQAPPAAADASPAALGIADIQNVVQIIDHACEQGAFKGWAIINQVAGVRSRLDSFLKLVVAAQEAAAAAAAKAEAEKAEAEKAEAEKAEAEKAEAEKAEVQPVVEG